MATRVLWSVSELSLNIGKQQIFDRAALSIHEGERLAMVGRNGCGKSTLLSVISGKLTPNGAQINIARNLRVAILEQDFTLDPEARVRDVVRGGLAYFETLLRQYESPGTAAAEHEALEHQLTLHDAWHPEAKLETVMTKLRLTRPEARIRELSGGEQRRAALAAAIVAEPDLLLLDEPTNHLDVESINWIEDYLDGYRGTCLLVTHDRYFLDRLATRVVELDHGQFFSTPGAYADFLAAKAERESRADVMEHKRQHFLRSEIEWVRRSPKARLRRNLGRLKRFDELSAQAAPERDGDMELIIPAPPRMGNCCLELKNLSVKLGEHLILHDLELEVLPGRKIGVIGPNGIGKTTMLKVITGELAPAEGIVKLAPTVEFNYVDQGKLLLDGERTVYEEISEGYDAIELGTEKVSIWGYLRRFLFEDERINTQIKYLSGGEKARLTLAKILKKGGNFLILDEPTNDLDLSSLRLLEEALSAYRGTLLLVSHDRYFLNRVCDGILAFEAPGEVVYNPGDYDYYVAKRAERAAAAATDAAPNPAKPVKSVAAMPESTAVKKLSFREQRELDGMESRILALENAISEREAQFAAPDFFARHGHEVAPLTAALAQLKTEAAAAYARWEELESRR